jgi:signal transduction histidine kinase
MKRIHTLRGRLTLFSLVATTTAIVLLLGAFNVLLDRSLRHDLNSRLRTQAAAATTTVTVHGDRLHVHESPNDQAIDRQVWIFAGRRAVVRPPSRPATQLAAQSLAGGPRAFTEIESTETRLYAAPLTHAGRRVGTIVAGLSIEPYDHTTNLALLGSLALAVVLLAAVYLVTWLTIGRALHPVTDMTRSAADWSEHDLDRRFGPAERPDELGELARTFDALLDRVAASLRHEQRLSAELSHELRTPLSRIVAEMELLQRRERPLEARREAFAVITRSAEQMSRILETLMAAARVDAQLTRGRGDVASTLDRLAATWRPVLAERSVQLAVEPFARPLPAGVDGDVVERIIAPIMENAARHARSRVVLTAHAEAGRIHVAVGDDGPGIPADRVEAIFEPGVRVDDGTGHAGAGLGLPLARRLARAAGGDVGVDASADGSGARFVVGLPA